MPQNPLPLTLSERSSKEGPRTLQRLMSFELLCRACLVIYKSGSPQVPQHDVNRLQQISSCIDHKMDDDGGHACRNGDQARHTQTFPTGHG